MSVKKNSNNTLLYFLLGLFFLVIFLYLIRRVLVVKKVVFIYDSQEINLTLDFEELIDQPLLFNDFDHFSFSTQVLYDQQNQAYQTSNYYKKFPQTLVILVQKQEPVYQIVYQDKFFLFDEQANKRQVDQEQDLVTIHFNQDVGTDFQLQANQHQFFVTMAQNLDNFEVKSIEYQNKSEILLNLNNGKKVWLELNDQLEENFERLKIILEQLKEEELGQAINEIDLRFKLPVLK